MDKLRYDDVCAQISGVLRQYKYVNKVAAEIYGKLVYLNEHQVRALQVICKRKADVSEELWKEFVDNVIVYSGRTKRKSKHKMIFRKDGIFYNEFEGGFYDADAYMTFEII